jgi:hypothetical protein
VRRVRRVRAVVQGFSRNLRDGQEEEEEDAVFEDLNAILAGHLEQEVPAASANAACEGHQQEHEDKEVEPGLRDRGSFGRYVLGFGRGETECKGRVRARDGDAEHAQGKAFVFARCRARS